MTRDELHAQALAEGFKDETCAKCGTLFEAHIHFVRCDARPCPMKSTTHPQTLFDMILGGRMICTFCGSKSDTTAGILHKENCPVTPGARPPRVSITVEGATMREVCRKMLRYIAANIEELL